MTTIINESISDRGLIRASLGLTVLSIAGFGFLYSLAGVGIGQMLFPETASGSLIERNSVIMGSSLIAQPFINDQYFQSRPSAAGYNPMAAAGSNQARTNAELAKRVSDAASSIAQREHVQQADVPSDLVTQSGGGLDPHISPQAAAIQIERVAKARELPIEKVSSLVGRYTEGPQFGMLGQPRVNVLKLNLALDQTKISPDQN